jgi:hypothetical protein
MLGLIADRLRQIESPAHKTRPKFLRLYLMKSTEDIENMVARDRVEPPTPAFQGLAIKSFE